jgi:hypothetical protein
MTTREAMRRTLIDLDLARKALAADPPNVALAVESLGAAWDTLEPAYQAPLT